MPGRSILCLGVVLMIADLTGCGGGDTEPTRPDTVVPTGPPEVTTVALPGGSTMDFIHVPPGRFTMGSPSDEEGRFSDEGPRLQVTLTRGFHLGRYEVTQGQWESVMDTDPWADEPYVATGPEYPAVCLSWNDVHRFLDVLNTTVDSTRFRLPTEAEWEYACRAGTQSRWSFGDAEMDLPKYAWVRVNTWELGLHYAQPVGGTPANPWGFHDLHGNVQEWVQNWYGAYSSHQCLDPSGPAGGTSRVIRGGSIFHTARYTRSACRSGAAPESSSYFLGVRLVMEE